MPLLFDAPRLELPRAPLACFEAPFFGVLRACSRAPADLRPRDAFFALGFRDLDLLFTAIARA